MKNITDYYQPLFNHIVENYGLHLHISEMDGIIDVVKNMGKENANFAYPLLADVLALTRHNPTSSGHYGYGYMCEDKNGEWVNREELLEILSKYVS